MNLSEIIGDAIKYPLSNFKSLLIYLVLGLLVGVVLACTGLSGMLTGSFNFGAGVIVGLIGIFIVLCLFLLMLGYSVDIIKLGINRSSSGPEIDFERQVLNGFKYIVVSLVYFIIPIIIIGIIGVVFKQWIGYILGVIVAIIFAFALSMAVCRLAETDELTSALNIPGAFNDLFEIGIVKVIIYLVAAMVVGLVIVFVLTFVITLICTGILGSNSSFFMTTIIPIFSSILDAWLLFYSNRVMGLVYSTK